jgi:diketogulonate reductase-like aldo/keto reductase
MCEKYGRSPAQIAINWLVSQPNVVTLSKMRNVEHIKENLGAIGWQMDEEDIDRLRRDFPNQQDVSDTVPLI